MFPISDSNKPRRKPYLTYALIALNVLVFLWQQTLSERQLFEIYINYAVVPLLISHDPFSLSSALDGLRSMFLHGGWFHLLSNIWYLWIFGDNIEDYLGRGLYLLYYLACGFVAIGAQVMMNPNSPVPMIGASGAIAGILGGYLLLYPRAKVRNLIFFGFFISFIELPAVIVLGFWFLLQLLNGAASLGVETQGGGVAFFAHIGGFLGGMFILGIARFVLGFRREPLPPLERRSQTLLRELGQLPSDKASPYSEGNPNRLMPRQVSPVTGLNHLERVAIQQANHALLLRHDGGPIFIIAIGRSYYGRILKLSDERVLLRESDGTLFNIPLENILKVG